MQLALCDLMEIKGGSTASGITKYIFVLINTECEMLSFYFACLI